MSERGGEPPGSFAMWAGLLAANALAGFGLAILSRGAWEPVADRLAYAALIAACVFAGAGLAFLLRRRSAEAAAGIPGESDLDESVIDESALEALRKLGGEAFVGEVISQFVSEGVSVLTNVARAAGDADAAQFASLAHALRSSAANVGARRLYRLCLDWRELPREELAISGAARFVRLQQEFDAAQRALRAWEYESRHASRRGPRAGDAGPASG